MPWLVDDEQVLFDQHRRRRAGACSSSRSGCATAPHDIVAEEADLAASLARTWDAPVEYAAAAARRVRPPAGAHRRAGVDRHQRARGSPRRVVRGERVGTRGRRRRATRAATRADARHRLSRHRVRRRARPAPSGSSALLVERGLPAPITDDPHGARPARACTSWSRRSSAACTLPRRKLAIAGRDRHHRPAACASSGAAAQARRDQGVFDDLVPGEYVVHAQHGVARYAGMTKRAIGGVERDYLLLEYRGDDKLYVPTDQIDMVRHYTGGDSPSLSKMGGADWAPHKATRARRRCRRSRKNSSCSTSAAVTRPVTRSGRTRRGSASSRSRSRIEETPDQRHAIDEVKADMEKRVPMDRLVVGDVGFGKTEVALRAAFKAVQDGKQVAILVPTTLARAAAPSDLQRALRRLSRCASKCCRASSPTRQAKEIAQAASRSARSTSSSAPIGCCPTTCKFKDLGLARRRRRTALRREPQGADQEDARRTSTCSRCRPRRFRARSR